MAITKIEFTENSKTVSANVKIEADFTELTPEEVIAMTKQLMNEAMIYSASKTMSKAR